MISSLFRRVFKLGIWAGLILTTIIIPSSAEKLSRPMTAAKFVVTKQTLPLGPWAKKMIVDQRLRLTGAWQLTSTGKGFGGLSAMMLARGELLLLSDGGALIRLRGRPDATESLAVLAPLPGSCGHGWLHRERDTESLALTPDGSGLRVGVETSNSLCAIDLANPKKEARFSIPAMQSWRKDAGAESITGLPGRAMVVIAEGGVNTGGTRPMLWFYGDPINPATPLVTMRYLPPTGYSPTDAAFLPDGRLLVINRRFIPPFSFSAKLVLVPAFRPTTGLTVTGKLLAQIDDPAITDNYEGIAIAPAPGGSTVWLVSDNNFSSFQRNLLLRFTLTDK